MKSLISQGLKGAKTAIYHEFLGIAEALMNKGVEWCRWGESNSHGSLHTPLKRTCLPVPPHRQS